MRKFLLPLVVIALSYTPVYAAATPISPIVQVRTFDAIQGIYPQELWNGSASLISKDGLLLTNNHVAQNQNEWDALGYIICMTLQQGKAPECNYTARLVARDTDMDLALLRLDNTDIAGNKIDLGSLPTVDVDYSYNITDWDAVHAIWYPWIGGDTITTTKGTVAGELQYNGLTYIKTDATIAPGNSWWPMMSSNGKQIGLNTFGISTEGEWLWYALLLWQAKTFIDKYASTPAKTSALGIDLFGYAKQIDTVNKSKNLLFPWVAYTIPAWYEIKNTVWEVSFIQTPKDQKEVQAEFVRIFLSKTPTLDTDKKLFYYLEEKGYYYKESTKLNATTIWWRKMYRVVSKYDETGWDGSAMSLYVGQLNKNALIVIQIYISGLTEKKLDEVKAEREKITNSITFKDQTYVPHIPSTIPDPMIMLKNNTSWHGDAVVQWYFNEDGAVIDIQKSTDNLHDSISLAVSKTTKATSIKKLFQSELKDVAKNMKALWTFQWYDAFIACNDKWVWRRGSPDVDENDKPLQQFGCTISTIVPGAQDISYRIDIAIKWPRSSKEQYLSSAITMLAKEIIIGNGTTALPNLFMKQAGTYKDLRDQTQEYRKKLDTLIGYGLLKKNDAFKPYTPVTYGLLAEKYLQMVHNISITTTTCKDIVCMLKEKQVQVQWKTIPLYDLFRDVQVDRLGYVKDTTTSTFLFYIDLKLAWVVLPSYTEETLYQIQQDREAPEYENIYALIDSYNANLYGSKKIWYDEVLGEGAYGDVYKAHFKSTKWVWFVPKQWIIEVPLLSSKPLTFTPGLPFPTIKSYNQCTQYLAEADCFDKYMTALWTYRVLDKGTLIDYLVEYMDFWLFDSELAKKKTTDIDDTTP